MAGDRGQEDELEQGLLSGTRTVPRSTLCSPWKMLFGFVALACLLSLSEVLATSVSKNTAPTFPIPESEQRNWSPYSPYFPLAEYKAPPAGCQINQVNIVRQFAFGNSIQVVICYASRSKDMVPGSRPLARPPVSRRV